MVVVNKIGAIRNSKIATISNEKYVRHFVRFPFFNHSLNMVCDNKNYLVCKATFFIRA
jgi:hypothetical protein